ncbi:beta-ketoacyl-[acyl-carrier-protein] synthase family protein [Actinophytocola gossypii]|uniref:Beta-ketoacyl-[acyl-carrier-protein] synthase family protein n=1 Tax=Actinophytocola gossypii TaxID=2812003 RepID=A0ABT2J6Q3_9PSEU|nr:beta-ketoacyl-[acyl-carrier-protein] synthase family protein [Actinophytocola gossypii]MCT2583536.1 beta-ketoacyl-[acyl-carrier-protein] synthase family protein [Actinophytocola gossypii]
MSEVVVTGAGVVSALGHDVPSFLAGLRAGEVAIHEAPWADKEHFAWWSGVHDFDPAAWVEPSVESGSDLFALFAVAAAEQALRQAGLDTLDPRRTGVAVGTSMGGTRALLKAQHQLETAGPDAVDRKTMIRIWPNMAAAQLTMRHGLHGPSLTFCTACASSLDAIGSAADLIRAGRADVVLAGGAEGGFGLPDGRPDGDFVPAVFHSQAGYGVTNGGAERLRASIPFDVDRRGIVVGEGSGMLVLERRAHAEARGATILGTVTGYASLADAYHPSSPDPTGRWEAETMSQALDAAGLAPSDVDAVIAHGTSTPKGDTAEIRAINEVHPGQVKVTSIKGNLGHPGGAAGSLSVVAALGALADGELPHTAGTSTVDPEAEFEVVTGRPGAISGGYVQVNAFGFGGQNASLVLGRD